jgi:hypothetical protein
MKFIGKIEIRKTKNELRPLSELRKIEEEYNTEKQIKLDFGKYIPLRVLNLEFEKLGLTEEKVRRCLFHDPRNAPLDLLEENYTKTSIVEEEKARQYLNELLGILEKRKETKRRKVTRTVKKRELKQKELQPQTPAENENK